MKKNLRFTKTLEKKKRYTLLISGSHFSKGTLMSWCTFRIKERLLKFGNMSDKENEDI